MFSRLLETRAIIKVGQITRLNSFACFYDPLIAVGIVCAQFQVVTDRSGCFSNIFLDFHKGCRGRERREEYRFFSLRNLSVARASVFLAPKLQFGVTAMARNPRSEMTRECKSCHVDSEMELKSEPPWWWSCAQNNNLFHWTDSHNTYTPLIMTTLPT